ncbi:MAG TPA: hypothetical protein VIM16_15350 [Mucilaginibacter sp.]|jgi:hypothetical protein
MKKQVQKTGALIVTFLLSIQMVSAQKADTSISLPSNPMFDRYMHKQKTFNEIGTALSGSGVAMILIGLVDILQSDAHSCDDCLFTKFQAGEVLIVGGAALALISAPFYVVAAINGRKARKVSLQLKSGNIPGAYKFNYVGVALKINL